MRLLVRGQGLSFRRDARMSWNGLLPVVAKWEAKHLSYCSTLLFHRNWKKSPTKYWQPNDTIRQVHTLSIPAEAAPGTYELRIGLYDPVTGIRVPLADKRGTDGSDYIVLATIDITP